jgi:hypothetical protein
MYNGKTQRVWKRREGARASSTAKHSPIMNIVVTRDNGTLMVKDVGIVVYL